MKNLPIVALIGQTNAGKSSLLNRFARKNIAIVAREEGTTRDNVFARVDNSLESSYDLRQKQNVRDAFLMVDTAGLKDPSDDFEASIQDQIVDAIDSAEVILVTLDSTKYFDHRDRQITKDALKSKKPVFLVLNKSDLKESLPLTEFRALGLAPENTFYVSATTGNGIRELKKAILIELRKWQNGDPRRVARQIFDDVPEKDVKQIFDDSTERGSASSSAEKSVVTDFSDACRKNFASHSSNLLKIALIGRPNVGKSSLFNTLAQKQQAVVSSRQGTTRDVNRVTIKFKGREIEILDTAGLRKPGKREVGIEKFSAIRTLAAIEEADICALLVDSTEPHSKLDQSLAGQITEAGKGIIMVVTKSDLLENSEPTNYFGEENIKNRTAADFLLDQLERDFDFLPYAPVIFTSSETGKNTTKLFDLALEVDEARHHEISTKDLNKILNQALAEHPAAGLKNTHPKPKYIVQTDTCPPWFVVHGHDLQLLHWSYKRFLERKIREFYPFLGTPICFSFRSDNSERQSRKDAYTELHGNKPRKNTKKR
ncbi:ribosome biogenesis GTPase Der [Candidatus Saccharibacteria bacterium]|nr:ribosome biogenesis GTPase Der [Candidatus Saccharibacteria bacterium]